MSSSSGSLGCSDPRLRKLKIATGVVKRIGKEKLSYRKEADQDEAKIGKMKEEGKPEIEIKKMREVMEESLMMIPDCHRRLEKALPDLQNLYDELKDEFKPQNEEEEIPEEITAAKEALEKAEEHLKAQ